MTLAGKAGTPSGDRSTMPMRGRTLWKPVPDKRTGHQPLRVVGVRPVPIGLSDMSGHVRLMSVRMSEAAQRPSRTFTRAARSPCRIWRPMA